MSFPGLAGSEPWRPAAADTFLITLPQTAPAPSPANSATPAQVLAEARVALMQAAASGDRRILAVTQAQLAPLRDTVPEARLLNAIALQHRHDFAAAMRELDAAEADGLDDAELHLHRAALHRTQGRFDEALSSCTKLRTAADPLLDPLCSLPVRGLTGELNAALEDLFALPHLSHSVWRDSEIADMLERQDDRINARIYWLRALSRNPGDPFLLGKLGFNLLDQQKPEAVLALIPDSGIHPHWRLIRIMAARQMGSEGWLEDAQWLEQDLLRAQRIHGEAHQRELAQLQLHVLNDPDRALETALENWQRQREPEDVLLLAEAATRAGSAAALEQIRAFVADTGYEDRRLIRFLWQSAAVSL